MPSDYPSFIFQDAVPASQMMAHAQAVNEGMRIQELGKARQAEGMFRMAQLQQQQKANREKTELDRMLAMSQIEQNRIANEFREKELTQRGTLESERNKNYAERSKLEFSPDRTFPQEALLERKIELEEEDRKRQEADDLRFSEGAERKIKDIDTEIDRLNKLLKAPAKLEGMWDERGVKKYYAQTFGHEPSDADLSVFVDSVKQVRASNNLSELTQSKALTIKGIHDRGLDYDPTVKRVMGLRSRDYRTPLPAGTSEAPPISAINTPATQAPAPSSFSLGTGQANLSPFDIQLRGLQPGQLVEQGGQRYRIGGDSSAPLPAAAIQNPVESTIAESLAALGMDERQVMPVSRGGYSQRDPKALASLLIPRLNAAVQSIVSSRGAGMPDAQQRVTLMRNLVNRLQSFGL